MTSTVTFTDPRGEGPDVVLPVPEIDKDLPDRVNRLDHIPTQDPHYVDLGMQYRLARLEEIRVAHFSDSPLHLALRGHMGTGKDHDLEQFAAKLQTPYYRIPLTGEVRDITLIGSVKLHGDGKGGTESRWQDGDITRALRGPAIVNLSELNAAGAETLFALHGLLDRHRALELPTGEMVRLRDDVRIFGTLNPTDLRDYAGTQTLNKAFADRWIIWEKSFPNEEDLTTMLARRHPDMDETIRSLLTKLAVEINTSFTAGDTRTRVETPMSLRTVLDRYPAGLRMYATATDPMRSAWEEFVLPHIDPYDRDHYETVWSAVVRKGPEVAPFST
ncbi:MAG TPA: AAA family ATPase [Acidimicrobiia bacterium]|nr:AAA family ATPase [Acidimicrobiia bacterium]